MTDRSARIFLPLLPYKSATTTLTSLQIGRGLAAMFVVLFHLNNSVWSEAKYFPHPFSPLLSFGNAGVQFFFVLSGFIIYLVHARDIGMPDRLKAFALKRFVRIYPTYWLVLAVFIVVLSVEPFWGTADQRRLGNLVASVLLIPWPVEPILSVAWTLKYEVMFYTIFAVAIINATTGLLLFAIWQLACIGNVLFGSSIFSDSMILSANNLLFAFGLFAAYRFKMHRCPAPGVFAMAGAALFLATGLHQVFATEPLPADVYVLSFGLASAVVILGACSYERSFGINAPRWLAVIGDASYLIYLVHLPLLSIFTKLLFTSGLAQRLPEWTSMLLLFSVAIAGGIAVSKTVEMPLVALLGKALFGKARRSRAQAAVHLPD
jgi:exopolysaccharide production protein ExoZ